MGEKEYGELVRRAEALLRGEDDLVVRMLEQRMAVAAERLCFEAAGRLKEALFRVRRFMDQAKRTTGAVADLDGAVVLPARRPRWWELFFISGGLLRARIECPLGRLSARVRLAMERAWLSPQLRLPHIVPEDLDQVMIVAGWVARHPESFLRRREGMGVEEMWEGIVGHARERGVTSKEQ